MDNFTYFVLLIIGGLFLFFQGILLFSSITKDLIKGKLFIRINKLKPFVLVIIGALISAIIQSSSACISILIPIISNGGISTLAAIYLVMGFNIGTTSTLFLTSLEVGNYSLILLICGLLTYVIYIIKKNIIIKRVGILFFSLGLIFFSLNMIKNSFIFFQTLPLYNYFYNNLTKNYFMPFFIGVSFTSLVQSSSVVTATFQQLYLTSNIDIIYIILIILGSNIGTTITGIFAALKANHSGKTIAFFHVFFNIAGCIFILILLFPFRKLILIVSRTLNKDKNFNIALCHLFFNLITMFIVFPFGKPIDRYLNFFISNLQISPKICIFYHFII